MALMIGEVEVVNEVALAPSAALYDGAVTADGDLTVRVNAFYYDLNGTHGKYLGSSCNAVTDNATNYVYLDALGALTINAVGYPGTGIVHIRLARVVALSGIIVRVVLERAFFTSGGTASPSTELAPIYFTFDTPSPMTLTSISANQVIEHVDVVFTTPFNDTSTVDIGTVLTPDLVLSGVPATMTGDYMNDESFLITVPEILRLSITPGGSTQGAGYVLVTLRGP